MNRRHALHAAAATVLTLAPTLGAFAHVSIPEKGNAGKSQLITFNVGHGCEGDDAVGIEIAIPPEVTTVRGVPSADFGVPVLTRNDANVVTKVTFTKTRVSPMDEQFYMLQIRIAVPNTPFVKLDFPVIELCKSAEGVPSMTSWTDTADGSEHPPASLLILPVRSAGWNKFTVPAEITDLNIFSDAEIVWSGDSAYSANPTTAELIAAEEGVTVLESIEANSEIWVKY